MTNPTPALSKVVSSETPVATTVSVEPLTTDTPKENPSPNKNPVLPKSPLRASMEREYTTKAPENITNSNLKPLDWITSYRDPQRFNDIDQLRSLFAEISKQKSVSDIIIIPDQPICLKTKRFGLRAITHRIISMEEAITIISLLTNDDSAIIKIQAGEALSGLAKVLDQENISANLTKDELLQRKINDSGHYNKHRFRYEITGCATRSTEKAFSCIMRPLPTEPLPYDQLGLTVDFVNQCIVKDGIVIIAGATGEGKSTTLSSVIRYVAENDTQIKGIILTHEDPIEVSYEKIASDHSVIVQSSIGQGQNILTFDGANRSAMRRSPDLILLGELRDAATVEAAVELSLTGHPVFATTHANSVAAIFPRLISRFPKEQQSQKTFDLIDTARVLISQKLIWNTQGKLFAVREVLPFTTAVRSYLLKYANSPDEVTRKIAGIMNEGLLGAESYEIQGRRMLEDGTIDEKNFNYLVERGADDLDSETLAKLDSL